MLAARRASAGVRAEALAEALDQAGDGVDRQRGLGAGPAAPPTRWIAASS